MWPIMNEFQLHSCMHAGREAIGKCTKVNCLALSTLKRNKRMIYLWARRRHESTLQTL